MTVLGDHEVINSIQEACDWLTGNTTSENIKADAGHGECASGVAALIKAMMLLTRTLTMPTSKLSMDDFDRELLLWLDWGQSLLDLLPRGAPLVV
jgi:hypothetical protein